MSIVELASPVRADHGIASRHGLDGHAPSPDWMWFESEFLSRSGHRGLRTFDGWLAAKEREGDVGRRIELFCRTHGHPVNDVRLSDVLALVSSEDPSVRTDHALRRPGAPSNASGRCDVWDLRKPDRDPVADHETPWAMMMVFQGFLAQHRAIHGARRLPRWSELLAFLTGAGSDYFLKKLHRDFTQGMGVFSDTVKRDRSAWDAVYDGFLWRWGCLFYSAVREIAIMATLKEVHGIPARYNIMADCLYGVDLVCGDVLVSVYIGNESFRRDGSGRKFRTADKMDVGAFREMTIELPRPRGASYGVPYLLPDATIAKFAAEIRSKMEAAR